MKNSFGKIFLSITPIAILFLLSTIDFNPSLKLEGYWIYDSQIEVLQQYDKHKDFKRAKPGIAFLPEGKLLKRQNAGWCGTPPVSYKNFDGAWEWADDQVVNITYAFWGGTIKESWKIVELKDDKLIIESLTHEVIKSNQR